MKVIVIFAFIGILVISGTITEIMKIKSARLISYYQHEERLQEILCNCEISKTAQTEMKNTEDGIQEDTEEE